MLDSGVSNVLKSTIEKLMEADVLKQFSLGGGTNLALKYNHRVSTDIDLFLEVIVGYNQILEIEKYLILEFKLGQDSISVKNSPSNQMSWLSAMLNVEGAEGGKIKLDVVQNVKLLSKVEKLNGISSMNQLHIF